MKGRARRIFDRGRVVALAHPDRLLSTSRLDRQLWCHVISMGDAVRLRGDLQYGQTAEMTLRLPRMSSMQYRARWVVEAG
jgi:hypothetical protein